MMDEGGLIERLAISKRLVRPQTTGRSVPLEPEQLLNHVPQQMTEVAMACETVLLIVG
jgi:hypothetical protein